MSAWQEQALLIPADHPSAAGHFPGHPIIPGALLLDSILAAIAPGGPVTIRGVKFLAPVAHGTELRLRWQAGTPVRFECTGPSGLVLSGTLAPEATP
jgi:3-hydroxymyristoyl/3-hydroxydecanoyl-(acyl carrier protein) dehydratase